MPPPTASALNTQAAPSNAQTLAGRVTKDGGSTTATVADDDSICPTELMTLTVYRPARLGVTLAMLNVAAANPSSFVPF